MRLRTHPRVASALFILSLVPAVLALSSCSTSGTGPSAASGDGTTRPTTPLSGFRTTTVTIVAADGSSRTICVLVADSERLRQQGLMEVEDRSLGGHDGMVFVFAEDVRGSFWMKHTRLPLSIAYLRADGSVASTTDMAPCPDDVERCPTYPPGDAYRYAIEVPQGELAPLGIGDGATVTVGTEPCGSESTATTG